MTQVEAVFGEADGQSAPFNSAATGSFVWYDTTGLTPVGKFWSVEEHVFVAFIAG
jgi:hypothetical protein